MQKTKMTKSRNCYRIISHLCLNILICITPLIITQCTLTYHIIDPGYNRRPQSQLHWHYCNHGHLNSDCALLEVPLDYDHPNNGLIHIGISRLKATNSQQRIGTLFVNPGGPGGIGDQGLGMIDGTGLDEIENGLSEIVRHDFAALREHFDVIGFDPRGTQGRGDHLNCSNKLIPEPHITLPPTTFAEYKAQEHYDYELGLACLKKAGPLIKYIGTDSVVKDVDSIRKALGETTISYYGQSYGTLIGQLYAEKYPTHLRAIILDSNENHEENGWTLIKPTALSLEKSLRYFNYLCKTEPQCTVPGKNLIKNVAKLIADAKHNRLKTSSGKIILPITISKAIRSFLLTPRSSKIFTAASHLLMEDQKSLDVLMSQPYLQDQYYQPTFNTAVVCHDFIQQTPTYAQYHDWITRLKTIAPHMYRFAGLIFVSTLSCLHWPIPAKNLPAPLHIRPDLAVLLITNRIDPATPRDNSISLHRLIIGSRLITTDVIGHCVGANSHCGRMAIVHYLLTTQLPEHDEKCHG